jgi:hypothetical protein
VLVQGLPKGVCVLSEGLALTRKSMNIPEDQGIRDWEVLACKRSAFPFV